MASKVLSVDVRVWTTLQDIQRQSSDLHIQPLTGHLDWKMLPPHRDKHSEVWMETPNRKAPSLLVFIFLFPLQPA